MAMSQVNAYAAAVEILKSGLAGKTIELHGCSAKATVETARQYADLDAAYLDTLIKGLVNTLTEK